MNRNLEKAVFDIEKVDAIMYAIESTYLIIDTIPEERARADRAINAFYALWDAIRKVQEDIDKVCEDEHVADVIYAVNESSRKKRSLKIE